MAQRRASGSPVAASQTRAVQSLLAVTIRRPSGLKLSRDNPTPVLSLSPDGPSGCHGPEP